MKDKVQWWFLGIAAAIVICGVWYTVMKNNEPQYMASDEGIRAVSVVTDTDELWEASENAEEDSRIKVHVTGAVKNPNIYELDEGSRINDAVEAAGGMTEDADLDRINLAAFVTDAQKIVIPAIGDTAWTDVNEKTAGTGERMVSDGLVDLNSASKSELMTLDGIGDSISQAIIDYRDKNGGFKSIDEIKKVSRIGEKTFEKIKDKIVVR